VKVISSVQQVPIAVEPEATPQIEVGAYLFLLEQGHADWCETSKVLEKVSALRSPESWGRTTALRQVMDAFQDFSR
jgi:hypothetical protein